MLKKLVLITLFGAASLSLGACDSEKSLTGIAECDQYVKVLNMMMKDHSDEENAMTKSVIEQFIKKAKENPTETKTFCKTLIDSMPPEFR